MLIVIPLLLGIVSFALLLLLYILYLYLISAYVYLCIILVATWVGGNVWLMSWMGSRGKENPFLYRLHRAWADFFYYTSLLQGLVFTVFVVWCLAIMSSDAKVPASRAEFILDFVTGSSVLAGIIFFFAVGVGGTYMAEIKGSRKLLAYLYALAALAVAVAPWVFADQMESYVLKGFPEMLFWGAIGIYTLLSIVGMRLMFGALVYSGTSSGGSEIP